MTNKELLLKLGIEHIYSTTYKDNYRNTIIGQCCVDKCPACAAEKVIDYYEALLEQARQEGREQMWNILKDVGQSLKQEPEKGNRDGKAL